MREYPDPKKQSVVLWVTIWIIMICVLAIMSQCHG